jgi:hypothetical protein
MPRNSGFLPPVELSLTSRCFGEGNAREPSLCRAKWTVGGKNRGPVSGRAKPFPGRNRRPRQRPSPASARQTRGKSRSTPASTSEVATIARNRTPWYFSSPTPCPVISAIIVAPERMSKTSAAAVPVTSAVASNQDLPIYLTGLGAVQASFAEGERVVVNGQYKLRQSTKMRVNVPTPAVAKQAQAS